MRHVVEVRAAAVGVVEQDDVAGARGRRRSRASADCTDHGIGTTCEPVSSDWATIWASGVEQAAGEVLALVDRHEYAVRNTVARISRTTEIRPSVTTSSVIGSISRPSCRSSTRLPKASTRAAPAGRHDGRGAQFLDDRRARRMRAPSGSRSRSYTGSACSASPPKTTGAPRSAPRPASAPAP